MKRVPVIPTILVGLAIALMIALGIWQLQRKGEKERLIAQVAANQTLPPIAFPNIPVGDMLLFRRATAFCLEPVGWTVRAGPDASGRTGWRQIAHCRTGVEGPGLTVQIGLAPRPADKSAWKGGAVRGYITHAPDDRPLIAGLFDHRPKTLMLVTDAPLAGLAANPGPDLSAIPNNHLAYAGQWFLFAAIAAIIYALALRRRRDTAEAELVTPRAPR